MHWLRPHLALFPYYQEALKEIMLCKFKMLVLPHTHWGYQTPYYQCETLREASDECLWELSNIKRAVRSIAKRMPWQCLCLEQAIVVRKMLDRRNLNSTLYLGLLKKTDKLTAHAWVRCGNQWVIGYQPQCNYTIVATYARIF